MTIKIYDVQYDDVIKSYYLTAGINYEYAIKKLVPLIDKLEFQRNPLRASFYKRLEEDIQSNCIMPNITVAICNILISDSRDRLLHRMITLNNVLKKK